jgi:hypothetical protein
MQFFSYSKERNITFFKPFVDQLQFEHFGPTVQLLKMICNTPTTDIFDFRAVATFLIDWQTRVDKLRFSC